MRDKLFSIQKYLMHWLRAKRGGHGIHSPFVYRLCEEVIYSKEVFYDFEKLEQIRSELLEDKRSLCIKDLGAPSKTFKGHERRVCDIASRGISSAKQSQLLYKLINYLGCKTGIELGSSIGLNSLYLAGAMPKGRVYSLEGNASVLNIAKGLAAKTQTNHLFFVEGHFDQTLPTLLTKLDQVDFVYLDGNHTKEATLRYFELLLPKMTRDSVFVLDDIYWSPDMHRAWKEVCAHARVTLSLDLFYLGILFFM